MLIAILIISVILFAFFNILPVIKGHQVVAGFFLLVAILSGLAIVGKDNYHFGTKVQTTSQTTPLVSSGDKKINVLLYQPLGNGQEKVYLYKTDDKQKAPKPIKTDHLKTQVKWTNGSSKMVVKEERYVSSSNLSRTLLGNIKPKDTLKQRTYTFYINKNWSVLSVAQAKQLAKALKSPQVQAQLKANIQQQAQKAVMEAMMKKPNMSATERAEVTQAAVAQAQKTAIQSLLQNKTK